MVFEIRRDTRDTPKKMDTEAVYLLKRCHGWGCDTAVTPVTPQQSDIDSFAVTSPDSAVDADR
jgi:hypothetical protein